MHTSPETPTKTRVHWPVSLTALPQYRPSKASLPLLHAILESPDRLRFLLLH